ncbi:GDSL-type esterase/lipase family protein [Halalkalibacter alkaliphilus]|uniref:GDSL-type esterase/lipase family protein n=1 Tax=Halalkalibacter alkaliphilus TaxID=2917993 RepID=A0A9X2CT75_9BACI|nr:GDSL-type esterase/lipase family protein [Halalkalibacter alkaliphilus]MCL7747680.1 GDSL-type esterase/lipase family protein [Halalkalibacter alkaliphilus]
MLSKTKRPDMIKPGVFGGVVPADTRRNVFDYQNEVLIHHKVSIDFVFIGDSITDRWEIETYFGGNNRRLVNRGIGGDMTQFLRRRFVADVVQLNPKYVVIQIGINNTWPLDEWEPENRKEPEQIHNEVFEDIKAIVSEAKEVGIIPIVCSLLPTCIETNRQTEKRNELVIAINQTYKNLADEEGIIYVDYHTAMIDESGKTLQRELANDGIHPHVCGYDIMAHVLRSELSKHGISI